MHNVGRFVMFQAAPEPLDLQDWHGPRALIAAETSGCGMTHDQLAAQRWELPRPIQFMIRDHHKRDLHLTPPSFRGLVRFARRNSSDRFPVTSFSTSPGAVFVPNSSVARVPLPPG
jgi:HD-like signal output (HDOD) protein